MRWPGVVEAARIPCGGGDAQEKQRVRRHAGGVLTILISFFSSYMDGVRARPVSVFLVLGEILRQVVSPVGPNCCEQNPGQRL